MGKNDGPLIHATSLASFRIIIAQQFQTATLLIRAKVHFIVGLNFERMMS